MSIHARYTLLNPYSRMEHLHGGAALLGDAHLHIPHHPRPRHTISHSLLALHPTTRGPCPDPALVAHIVAGVEVASIVPTWATLPQKTRIILSRQYLVMDSTTMTAPSSTRCRLCPCPAPRKMNLTKKTS